MQNYKLKITTLTPIHIGTGDVYEPTNFVIDGGFLYEFDEFLFLKSLDKLSQKAFNSKLNDYIQIIDFYKNHIKEAKQVAFNKIEVTLKVENKYKTIKNKDGSKNQNLFEIHKTIKNSNTSKAIIPGSSIKGMFDTVFQIYPPRASNEIRQKLIISDALMLKGDIKIGFSYRKHKNPDKEGSSNIPQIIEIIKPKSEFIFSMKTQYEFSTIIDNFISYFSEDSRKNNYFKTTNKSFVARIGKFSGKAFMVDDGKNVLKPVTHTLFEDNTEFGWIKIELIDEIEYQKAMQEILNQEKEYITNLNKKQKTIREKIDVLKKQKEKERLEREKRLEEERQKEELKKQEEEKKVLSMNPTERLIYELTKKEPSVPETTLILNNLDEFENRCEALQILKEKMIALKEWKEISTAKNPKKDKKHQKTLKVMQLIKEC